jgi:hypothetical protein
MWPNIGFPFWRVLAEVTKTMGMKMGMGVESNQREIFGRTYGNFSERALTKMREQSAVL